MPDTEARRLAKEYAKRARIFEDEKYERATKDYERRKAEAAAKGERIEEEEIRKKTFQSEDFRTVDSAAINGGGFHLFNFEFLADDDGKVWMLDIDSLPNGDKRHSSRSVLEGGGSGRWLDEELLRDVLVVAGWIPSSDRPSSGKEKEARKMAEMAGTVIPKICASFAEYASRNDVILCEVRLGEMALELYGSRSPGPSGSTARHGFTCVHPTARSCQWLREEREELDILDVQQCSAVLLADEVLRMEDIERVVKING